ncbi:MAG: cobalamin biosynthesis protein [Methylocystis sp.]|nr:cobalamin biosynthesis protein [Methylocystis sp.]
MTPKSPRYCAGIGARRGVDAQNVVELVTRVAAQLHVALGELSLCTHEGKAEEAGLREAAHMLGVPIRFASAEALRERRGAARTHSPRVRAMFGVGSIAEAAALVGAGPGSRLLAPRITTPVAACAIAERAGEMK